MENYLIGEKIKLVKFTDRYITLQYVTWLNDQKVNRYLHVGRIPIAYNELSANNDSTIIKFAILSNMTTGSDGKFWKDDDYSYYIGTCTIHNIDWISRRAEIGYMIGDKAYWGHGIATELIGILIDYAFDRVNLNKLIAGVVDGNIGSTKALETNGFKKYCVEKSEYYLGGKYLDCQKFHHFREWYYAT